MLLYVLYVIYFPDKFFLSQIYHKPKGLTKISWSFSSVSEITWNKGLWFFFPPYFIIWGWSNLYYKELIYNSEKLLGFIMKRMLYSVTLQV